MHRKYDYPTFRSLRMRPGGKRCARAVLTLTSAVMCAWEGERAGAELGKLFFQGSGKAVELEWAQLRERGMGHHEIGSGCKRRASRIDAGAVQRCARAIEANRES